MCGISGTIFNKDYYPGMEVRNEELYEIFNSISDIDDTVEKFLDKCWEYKSNINFLRYCNDEQERIKINILSDKIKSLSNKWIENLPHIDKNKDSKILVEKYRKYENLLDCQWFLSNEIPNWYNQIKFLSGDNFDYLNNSAIVFYKNLVTIINSIDNRLEFRGRDSLGISIQLFTNNFNNNDYINISSNDNCESFFFEKFNNFNVFSFLFKTANPIGSLGDNAAKLKVLIKNNKLLNQIILNNSIIFGSIVIHTRWASVGKVNINNCHPITNSKYGHELRYPLIIASLNGDIYNYNEIISDTKQSFNLSFDEKCDSDCLAIPLSLTGLNNLNVSQIKDSFNKYIGSFAVALQSSQIPDQIILSRKGNQGLYIGLSYDNIMFSSDIYGLIESCRYYYPIESGSIIPMYNNSISISNKFQLEIQSLDNNHIRLIKYSDLKTSNITTRDIDKKNYSHFLKKEIYETKDIVQKTILRYLQPNNLIDPNDFHNAIIIDKNQIPHFIVEKLISNQIKQIVITGMGTCYTAATAIAKYMREMLRKFIINISVEPHIASEGSAFYLEHKMDDILVIVIAQSGTTVDTNVYVQMAKDRGAMSIALANKREGDVTFIVDGTLYIGSGRDIEIAVPSTKTYTAQVILGYILTLYFCCKLNQKYKKHNSLLINNIHSLRKTTDLIDETFEYIKDGSLFNKIRDYPLTFNSWYLIYDNSPASVCGMEIRIKYSEGCYHSLPYLHIDEISKINIKNSFITYITNEEINLMEKSVIKIIENNNSVILIAPIDKLSNSLKKYVDQKILSVINIPFTEKFYSFIPTVINGQLLSYYAAQALDNRKENIKNLITAVKSPELVVDEWNVFESEIMKKTFNQGFSTMHFIHLSKLYDKYKEKGLKPSSEEYSQLLKYLNELYQFSRRPIDTIKHQAKTITVGTVRESKSFLSENSISYTDMLLSVKKNKKFEKNEINYLINEIDKEIDINISKSMQKHIEFLVFPVNIDESYGYFVVNLLNEIRKKLNLNIIFRLAYNYDVNKKDQNRDNYWIFISDGMNISRFIKGLSNNQYVVFDYSVNENNGLIRYVPKFSIENDFRINYSLGSIYIANTIAKYYCNNDNMTDSLNLLFRKELMVLNDSWKYVQNSKRLKEEIHIASKIFLSRRNLKCLGSGVNYNISKFAAKQIINNLNRSCAFDVLENHKHIDISAESAILIFIANIWREGYQNDVFPEIEKLISHENIPIIISNLGDRRFDEIRMRINYGDQKETYLSPPIIKLPKVDENYSFPLNVFLVNKIVNELVSISKTINNGKLSKIALDSPSNYRLSL